MERFVNLNYFKEVLYVVKSNYQASSRLNMITTLWKSDYQTSQRLDMIINAMKIMIIKQVQG